jgi:hypothetical protein
MKSDSDQFSQALDASETALHESYELIDRKAGLSDDTAQGARLKVPVRVHRNRNSSHWISGVDENVMAADDPVDDEAGAGQGSDDSPAADRRQSY